MGYNGEQTDYCVKRKLLKNAKQGKRGFVLFSKNTLYPKPETNFIGLLIQIYCYDYSVDRVLTTV